MKEFQKTFDYKGNSITFNFGGDQNMINATQMAKAFNKRPGDYLRTQSAKDLWDAITWKDNCLAEEVVKVVKGNSAHHIQGTWMHEDIALDFAQWLSVEFKLWCNDRIKELLTTGSTSIKPMSTLDMMEATIKHMRIQEAELNQVKQDIKEIKAKTETKPDYFTIAGYGTLNGYPVNVKTAASLGRKASAFCKREGLPLDTIPDPRFGRVNMYPIQALDFAFENYKVA